MHLAYHPEFCITIVSNFSWVLQSSQDEIQNNGFEGVNKEQYGLGENGEC